MVASVPKIVALTGFGPFRNFTVNPSELVARALNGVHLESISYRIKSHIFAVDEPHVANMTERVYRDDPKVVIHMGYEDIAKGLRIEVAASNDLANSTRKQDGPEILPTTLNLNTFQLVAKYPYMQFSRNAGTFFCNEIYYRSLFYVRSLRHPYIPVVFIHLSPEHVMSLPEKIEFVYDLITEIAESVESAPKAQIYKEELEKRRAEKKKHLFLKSNFKSTSSELGHEPRMQQPEDNFANEKLMLHHVLSRLEENVHEKESESKSVGASEMSQNKQEDKEERMESEEVTKLEQKIKTRGAESVSVYTL